jgi:protein-L-isoaspartate O-methyltransferase
MIHACVTGSGYVTACLRELVGPSGKVIGIERYENLVDRASKALEFWKPGVLDDGSILILEGNALEGEKLKGCMIHMCWSAGATLSY